MIILLDKNENDLKNIMIRKFRRYRADVLRTGLDYDILKILIQIYMIPEFNTNNLSNEKSKVL